VRQSLEKLCERSSAQEEDPEVSKFDQKTSILKKKTTTMFSFVPE
jgi:hypothetical protein